MLSKDTNNSGGCTLAYGDKQKINASHLDKINFLHRIFVKKQCKKYRVIKIF